MHNKNDASRTDSLKHSAKALREFNFTPQIFSTLEDLEIKYAAAELVIFWDESKIFLEALSGDPERIKRMNLKVEKIRAALAKAGFTIQGRE